MTIKQRITQEIKSNNEMIEYYKANLSDCDFKRVQVEKFTMINTVLERVSQEGKEPKPQTALAKDTLYQLKQDLESQKQEQEIMLHDAETEFPIAAENNDLNAVMQAMIEYNRCKAAIESLDYVLQTINGMMRDLK